MVLWAVVFILVACTHHRHQPGPRPMQRLSKDGKGETASGVSKES